MDAEKLAFFKNQVSNLSDNSTITDYKRLVTLLVDLYIGELPETLSGGALTTEINAAIVARDALNTELDKRTDLVKK